MDFDSFFTSPRWKILEIVAKKPSAPLEIAKQLNTSMAYISQQLKLLEAAGLIVKQRTGSAERGKPRMLFSPSNDIFYVMVLTKKFALKKMINLEEHHKTILRIWLLDNSRLRYYLEKFYWKIEEDLKEIAAISFDTRQAVPKILVFSDSRKVKQKTEAFFKDLKGKLECSFLKPNEFEKFSLEKIIPIYESSTIQEPKDLKGGQDV